MTEKKISSYLAKQKLFHGMSSEFIEFLAGCASEKHLRRGDVLFRHGERADRFYLLRSGRITIEVPAITGPSLEVQSLGPGEVLGWSWVIPPYKWMFQTRAEEPTDLLEFDGNAVLDRCEQEPRFGYEVLKRFSSLMSERLAASRRKMMEEWNPPGFA